MICGLHLKTRTEFIGDVHDILAPLKAAEVRQRNVERRKEHLPQRRVRLVKSLGVEQADHSVDEADDKVHDDADANDLVASLGGAIFHQERRVRPTDDPKRKIADASATPLTLQYACL